MELLLTIAFLFALAGTVWLARSPDALAWLKLGKPKQRELRAALTERLGPRLTEVLQACRGAHEALSHTEREARAVLARVQRYPHEYVRLDEEIEHANLTRDFTVALGRLEGAKAAWNTLDHHDRVRVGVDSVEFPVELPPPMDGAIPTNSEHRKKSLVGVLQAIQRSSKQLAELESSLVGADGGPYRDR